MKHLNATDRHLLVHQLESMKEDVLEELRTAAALAFEGSGAGMREVHGRTDDAEAARIEELREAEIEIDRRRLHEIERALQRVAEGSYGICADCGEEIPYERLLVRPTAMRCAACQVVAESRPRR
ncbi:DnaK suppressor protein [Variovorax sp. TBS-050B]|uniref:TraR/DksA family transcriptional regulator n=1 Tax=Variovorax sp. TBS-050B TaxID=2940551 RepID=UPI002475CDCA|nr:TraR/DksA family transcriptional regulator [Variovorax sp. TBS-050B]MDH6590510.1 DnaK suppressor protein [Variovorax sp. TBS-050B]